MIKIKYLLWYWFKIKIPVKIKRFWNHTILRKPYSEMGQSILNMLPIIASVAVASVVQQEVNKVIQKELKKANIKRENENK